MYNGAFEVEPDASGFCESPDANETHDIPDINELPPSVPSCYIINQAYQNELEIFKEDLERKLIENRALQEKLYNEEPAISDVAHPNSALKFLVPYFRDRKGFKPEDNDDTKSRKLSGAINFFYRRKKKPWNDQDINNLRSAVESCVRRKTLEPYTRKQDSLLAEIDQLEAIGADQDTLEEKIEKLENVRNEINEISELPVTFFYPPPDKSDDIDWLWVSSQCSALYNEFDCEIKWSNYLHPEINHEKWTSEEESKLKQLCKKIHTDWDMVAVNLGTKRTAWECFEKYQSHFNERIVRSGQFTYEENCLLKKLVDRLSIGDYIPWHQVAYFMTQRSLAQIKHFWNKINCSRRGAKWNELEDKVLLAAVEKHGTRNWKHVAYFIPGRSNRQCRERYMMRLGIKDRKLADWTFNEDCKLIQIAPNLKFRWIEMMAHILKRNARQIAARYDTLERCRIANDLRYYKDLQDLVPRKKSSKSNNFIIPELQLEEGQTIDDFLRSGKKELEINLKNSNYRPKISRLGNGGRPKRAERDEIVEQELVHRFSFYSLIGKLNPQVKRLDRASQEAIVLDVLNSLLQDYFSGKLPEEPHLLVQIVSAVLKKQVIGLNPDKLGYCPPIFPPNLVTTNSYQCLLFMKQHLIKQLEGKTIDTSQHEWHPNYRALLGFLVSVYYWPCFLSTQPPESTQPPKNQLDNMQLLSELSTISSNSSTSSTSSASFSSTKKHSKRRKKSQSPNIDYLNEAREKQRYIFALYQGYLESKARQEVNPQSNAI
ncbi:snRNA-activating protein complex subunit 4 [Tetranychus urticae]|uniref:snRNA-activating protein complex subunit 4 n=1 Tax=Tetranychus urticae TaxID=32264 RepID=UPI00077C0B84|nr:snRNA-activating protein complex subunit 4 [Tetranychus urticae]